MYDVYCEICGHTDETPGGWGQLVKPCYIRDINLDVVEEDCV